MANTIAIHISPAAIHIMSGGLHRSGSLHITKSVTWSDCQRFFESGQLCHLQALVDEVVDTIREENIHGKRLAICYEGKGMETEFVEQPLSTKGQRAELKTLLKADFSDWKKQRTDKQPDKKKVQIHHGILRKTHDWGDFTTTEKSGRLESITTADYDLVVALVSAFAEHGYKVESVESTATALLYCKHAVPTQYDAQHQLLLHVNPQRTEVQLYTFAKNIPWKVETRRLLPDQDLPTQLESLIQTQSHMDSLRNPVVLLAGTMVLSGSLSLCEDGQYLPCVGLLWKQMERDGENLVLEKMRTSSVRNLRTVAQMLTACAGLALVVTTGFAVHTAWAGAAIQDQLVDVSAVTLTQAEHLKTTANNQLTALGYEDDRITELMTFLHLHTPDNVHIISVDTDNAFQQPEVVSTLDDGTVLEVVNPFTSSTQETIRIRGFATQSNLPVMLYERLTATEMGAFTLVGTKLVTLPDDSILYAFEIALTQGGGL